MFAGAGIDALLLDNGMLDVRLSEKEFASHQT